LVVSPLLLEELERALGYPKLRRRIPVADAEELITLLRDEAELQSDPSDVPILRSADPGDDYLISLAAAAQAVIVSGDGHLLALAEQLPVFSPASFLRTIEHL
jgi:uncharacterized protein